MTTASASMEVLSTSTPLTADPSARQRMPVNAHLFSDGFSAHSRAERAFAPMPCEYPFAGQGENRVF
jgi:hypothetical protein